MNIYVGNLPFSYDEARAAIQEIDGSDVDGRRVKANEARPRIDRPARQRY